MIGLTDEEIKGKILDKLVRWKKFMASYTDKRDSVKGLPPHLRGEALNLIDEMVKDRILIEHKGKKCISINLTKMDEVNRLRAVFLEKKYTKNLRRI
jgi:hypothetical protein